MKQRIVSILLTLALCLSMLPATAFAAGTGTDTGKAIQLGTSGIAGYDSAAGYDYIYFGSWTAQDTYTTSGPIKWRVLDDQTNTRETGLFLLSDGLLGTGYYGGVYFDNTSPYSNTWQGSDAQAWCNTFASSNLDSRELAAILETTKSDVEFPSSTYSVPFAASENILNGDKVFFLSAEEAENSAYGFANDNARIANYGGSACAWWLRSPYAGYTDGAGAVYGYGYVDFITVNDDWAARPAFNLDLTSVLFTSAAAGGKSASGMDSGLTAVDDYTGSEWKLTLLDETREFAVTEQTVSGAPGDTITLNYTGATTGTNEYISVIIADENGAQYYGRVAQPGGESGTATLSIPADLAPGSYTLNVFSEQYNGDYKTDYASAFAEVALTVEEAAAPGIDTGKAIQLVDSGTAANIGGGQADNIYFGTYQQSSDGNSGYNIDPIKWRVLENANGQLFLLSDQNLDVFQYHTDSESVTWEKSTMRSWLNGYSAEQNTGGSSGIDYTSDNFIGTAFSEKEQKAIADTTVVNDDNPDHNTEGGNDTTDQIFLLSIEEVQNADYGFTDNSSRIATNTAYVAGGGEIGGNMLHGVGEADYWWLRSPGDLDHRATGVSVDGGVGGYGYSVRIAYLALRPAFNLDLNSVLFTSAAVGGKSANGMDSGLTAIGNYAGNEWKLTLLDKSRSFAVTEQTVSGKPGDTITLNYTGATTGENEYISVIIADENGAQYYGRVAQPGGESGTATLSIPADLAPGSYTLNVFSEQYNGDYMTDYASAFAEVSLTVEDTTAPTLSGGSATRDSENAATVRFTSSEAGEYYYAVAESGAEEPSIDTTVAGTSCISGENTISLTTLTGLGAKDIYIVAKDAAGNVSQSLKIEIPAYTVVPKTYTLTVDLNGGSGGTIGGAYAAGEVVNIYAGSRSNYRFNGWTSSNGGTFADASKASTTFTMPAADTTITANWRYIGGGTTPSNPTKTPSQQAVDKIEDAKDGDTVEIALPAGQTTLDKEVFETLAGRDVTLEVSLPGGVTWTVNGQDIPRNAALVDIGMGVSMGTSTIPVDLINAVTGEVGTVQLTLQHDGPFGFAMTLTAPLGAENAGLWANLYHYDEDAGRMAYRSSAVVGADGNASLPFDHAGQYALVLDDKSHELPFTDLEDGAWYLDAVGYAYRHDLMGGYGGTSLFGPDDGLLREQAAQVVWNLMGEGDGSRPAAPHADVAQGRWYSPAVNWAVDAKVMDGYDADTFGVGDALTREQFAAVVAKAAGADVSAADAASLDVFSDAEDVSGWAVQTMAWAVETGIINGVEGEDGSRSLDATRALTRAEMAAMVMNAVDKGVLTLPSKQNA